MAKIYTYFLVIYGTLLLLHFAGIPTGMDALLSKFDFFDNSLYLWGAIAAMAALCIGGGLAIAALTKTSPDLYIAGAFSIASLLPLVAFFPGVINYAHTLSDWVYYIVWLIFGIFGVGYIISIADWIMNRGSN